MTITSTGLKADVAPVCSGVELELMCLLASGRVLEWSITLMSPENEAMTLDIFTVDSVISTFPMHTVVVNGSIMFIFSRISPPNSQPLISRLLISPATSVVNGSVVICADRETRNSASTTVNVVHNNPNYRDTLTDHSTVKGRFLTSAVKIKFHRGRVIVLAIQCVCCVHV